MTLYLLFALGYLILPHLLLYLATLLRRFLLRRTARPRRMKEEQPKPPIYKRISKYTSFARKKRDPVRLVLLSLYLIGLALSIILGAVLHLYLPAIFSILIPYILMYVAYVTTKGQLAKRAEVMEKMMALKQSKMGIAGKSKTNPIVSEEIQILKWDTDLISPLKVRLSLPVTFDMLSAPGFMQQFNQVFGTKRSWVADVADEQHPGWDYNGGFVTLTTTKPMPDFAEWDEHYVLNPNVAWSFFPLGLGTEHGIKLVNPKTGEEENVLGFDVQGDQVSLAKKVGMVIGPELTASPQALCAGSTGGGKALALTERVRLFNSTQSVSMNDVQVGMPLQGTSEEKPALITDVFDIHIPEDMYEIQLEGGKKVKCSGDHLWYIETKDDRKRSDELYESLKTFYEQFLVPEESVELYFNEQDFLAFWECETTPHEILKYFVNLHGPRVELSDDYYYSMSDLLPLIGWIKQKVRQGAKSSIPLGKTVSTYEMMKLMDEGEELFIPTHDELLNKRHIILVD